MVNLNLYKTKEDLYQLREDLCQQGCLACDLGKQPGIKGPALFRGNPESSIMCVGEALGLVEDIERLPFVGPAGKKGDEIFRAIGLDTNRDCIMCNVVACRPVAPAGSGKQNLIPSDKCINICSMYLEKIIEIVDPKIIVALGKTALLGLVPGIIKKNDSLKGTVLGKCVSRSKDNRLVFTMYHPSYLLRKNGPALQTARQEVWEQVKTLKQLI
jgi:DNA polymerase